jgi:hypothetical protein
MHSGCQIHRIWHPLLRGPLEVNRYKGNHG